MTAHLLTSDLAISSHVVNAARTAGFAVEVALDVDRLCANCTDGARLVILDLNHAGLDAEAVVARLRQGASSAPAIVAFAPHVHAAKLAAARAAGCDEVFTRGQFHTGVAAILGRYLPDQPERIS